MCYNIFMVAQKTNTIIISDVHLGSGVSRAKKLLSTLKKWNFKRLILLGDIFDDLDFRNLNDDHWNLLAHIQKCSKKSEVVWVEGNHDKNLSMVMSSLLGIKVYKKYSWKFQDENYLAIHGHQFDRFLKDNYIISLLATYIYFAIQKIDFKDLRISHYLKRSSKGWLRLSDKVARSAARFGSLRGIDYIFCGHTHKAMERTFERIVYFNSGCWTDVPSTFITIDEEIEIHEVK